MAELTDAGFVGDTLDEQIAEFDSEFRGVFGATIDLTAKGYTGREIPIVARSVVQLQGLTADTITALDLNNAQGRQLDAAGVLLDEPRKGATQSTIEALLFGAPGVLVGDKKVRYVRNSSQWRTPANDPSGDPLAIGANGTLATTLTAVETGVIQAGQDGTGQWVIIDTTSQWDALESTADSVDGVAAELDPSYRARLRLAGRGSGFGTLPGVQRALRRVAGNVSVRVLNNRNNTTDANGVPGKHVEAVIEGGTDADIGQAILDSYGGSDGFAGQDTATAIDLLGKTHTVRYTRVDRIDVVVNVTIDTTGAKAPLPDNAASLSIGAVDTRVNGLDEGINVAPDDLEAQVRALFDAGTIPENGITVEIGLLGGAPPVDAALVIAVRQRARTNAQVQAAQVVGTQTQTFVFVVTWVLSLAVDGGNVQQVTFQVSDFDSTGAATALEIATVINNQTSGIAAGSELGALAIASESRGVSSSINILAATAPALLTELGLSLGLVNGSDGDIAVTIV